MDYSKEEVDAALRNINGMGQCLSNVMNHMGNVDACLGSLNARLGDLEARVNYLKKGQDKLFYRTKARIEDGEHSMHDRIEDLESSLDEIAMQMKAAKFLDAELEPLVAIETGEPIDGFPRTIRDIRYLPGRELIRILALLGLPTAGSREAKRCRLIDAVGVVEVRN
ncbi:hypothetical protein F5Y11DRAFT_349991 [Daldinia sp. FL1419]|nr:hypothetical protein F5Y11DRAFT_349991 [Daldinia sp. FL1419]